MSFAFLFIHMIKMFYLFQNIKHRSLSLEKLKPSISREPNLIWLGFSTDLLLINVLVTVINNTILYDNSKQKQ